MAQHLEKFLSKVLDDNDVQALIRHNIDAKDAGTPSERKAYAFIRNYAQENGGQAPSLRAMIEAVPEFTYREGVTDSFGWVAKGVKEQAAKRQFYDLFAGMPDEKGKPTQPTLEERINSDGNWLEDLQAELESIKMGTSVRNKPGRTLSEIKESMRKEYEDRESGKSFKTFDTPFPSFTKEIGKWFTGDIYGITAESGRGKTYLICVILDSLLRQGAKVLTKSFEVKEYVFISRLISVATAVDEMFMDELQRKVGIPNKAILSGSLDEVVREKFFEVVDALDDYYEGTLYFQGKSGKELTRTLDDLERELSSNELDAVILDPFYGITDVYGRNSNKTTGGAAEQAATRFENIVGDHDVVGFYTVQATVDKPEVSEDGVRELELPTRDQIKTSKRLLDIATVLIGFDSVEKEGIAMVGVSKGRNGGEDFTAELTFLPDYGVVKELETGALAAEQFTKQF